MGLFELKNRGGEVENRYSHKGSILRGAVHTHGMTNLDVGQGGGLAGIAEGGALVHHNSVGGVVHRALEGNLDAVHSRDSPHQPGFSLVGLLLAPPLNYLGIELEDALRVDRIRGRLQKNDFCMLTILIHCLSIRIAALAAGRCT